jgi:hypothetical protein
VAGVEHGERTKERRMKEEKEEEGGGADGVQQGEV